MKKDGKCKNPQDRKRDTPRPLGRWNDKARGFVEDRVSKTPLGKLGRALKGCLTDEDLKK